MATQARRWGAIGGVGWIAACHVSREHSSVRLNRSAGLAWWAAAWRMLDWHLGMAEGGDGVPRRRLSPADAVTLSRFWLVPLVVAVRDSERGLPAAVSVGGVTDWLDGALARRGGRTRLGPRSRHHRRPGLPQRRSGRRATRRPASGRAWAIAARHAIGLALALTVVFGRARRPAIRARPEGAMLRIGGLTLAVTGARRTGTTLLVLGCATPPRSTARDLSIA